MPPAAAITTACTAVSVNISDIRPAPVPIYPGSTQLLFKPVYHFWSGLNRTKDGVWPPHGSVTTMDHWFVVESLRQAAVPYIWTPEERLYEGWYNIQVCAAGARSRCECMHARVCAVSVHVACNCTHASARHAACW